VFSRVEGGEAGDGTPAVRDDDVVTAAHDGQELAEAGLQLGYGCGGHAEC
jgi:hypothetical protein